MKHISRINTVHNFVEVMQAILKATHDSLVLFDVDEVIVTSSDEYRLTHDYREKLLSNIAARLLKEQYELLLSVIMKDRKVRFVNPKIVEIFNILQEKKIPAMGLTKLATGKFGIIDDMVKWRMHELEFLNVNFATISPISDEILVNKFNIGYGYPMLKAGIIYTAEYNKGSVLEYILQAKNYYPKSIIFIDDILENLESLQQVCNNLNIDYQGFEFTGSAIVPEPDLNEQLEKIRFQILEQEYRWLTDNQLKQLVISHE